jgi:hypothetical protein
MPHRGSDKAAYGKILANVASTVMHKLETPQRLAEQDTLARLKSDFRHQLLLISTQNSSACHFQAIWVEY